MDAELFPNRSLPNTGFFVLMGVLIALAFTAGAVFASIGAWPVPFFFGLEIVLVWLAFKLSYRQGRRRELIRIGADRIAVHRRHPNGRVRHYVLPTAWTRAEIARPGEHQAQLRLAAYGRTLVLGAFLSPAERERLGVAVIRALGRARAAPQEAGGGA
ncbi:MAG: DUF2244 domain-containing protein [Maricaulaceae bacterium]|nr:DUF2244 domain-containing protein [Maricaulaceae bacterium]